MQFKFDDNRKFQLRAVEMAMGRLKAGFDLLPFLSWSAGFCGIPSNQVRLFVMRYPSLDVFFPKSLIFLPSLQNE